MLLAYTKNLGREFDFQIQHKASPFEQLFAPWGSNLNKPLFKSSNAELGVWGKGLLISTYQHIM